MQTEYTYDQYMKLLNTEDNEVIMQSILTLKLNYQYLTKLPILPPNLQTLQCISNKLKAIPPDSPPIFCDLMYNFLSIFKNQAPTTISSNSLPSTLITLIWSDNQLSKLPDLLPPTLITLICSHNQLSKLPDSLPPTLITLICSDNQLSKLPDSLPPNLNKLDCSYNKITKLPDSLPPALHTLTCCDNQLTKLPDSLPPNLNTLYCYNNQLTKLPNSLPPNLHTLICSYNNLIKLPDLLPPTLQILNCSYNQLTKLSDSLPPNLNTLMCNNNQLTKLPDLLPLTLQYLCCQNNHLIKLPGTLPLTLHALHCNNNLLTTLSVTLPLNLYRLDCSNNQLTTLPNSITRTQCTYLNFSNNPIEYLPIQINRWLNRIKTHQHVYQDSQSVHNHSIQLGIMDTVTWLTRTEPTIELHQVIEAICEANESFQFQPKSKQLLMEYCNDPEVHGTFQLTFAELLTAVWSHILTYPLPIKNEIWKVMDTEMQDAECKCFTGRMSRLVNCLNGFDDRIKIHISDNEQIGNIIAVERNRIESLDSGLTEAERVALLKTNVALALKERAYSDTVIQEWIEYIE